MELYFFALTHRYGAAYRCDFDFHEFVDSRFKEGFDVLCEVVSQHWRQA